MMDPNKKYGIRPSTRWREVCIEHLKNCSDPKCHVKVLMRMWNELGGWKGYEFAVCDER